MGLGNDYVKHFTKEFVKFMDQSKEERMKVRDERRQSKETFVYRWFGILPYLIVQSNRKKKHRERE